MYSTGFRQEVTFIGKITLEDVYHYANLIIYFDGLPNHLSYLDQLLVGTNANQPTRVMKTCLATVYSALGYYSGR